MKKILIGATVVIALGIIAFVAFRSKEEEPKFRTEKVTKGDIVQTVTATGTVNAVTTVLVGTQVSGTIKHIYVDFNSPVKKGQLIAQIDPATFEAQVEQAKANLLLASANLEKAEASLVDAQRTMNRNRELFSRNLIARSELDTSETNYETAKAQVSASKAQVSQAEAALKNAETNLRYTRILSPVDGIVISRNVDVGQTVAATFQTPTLFTIAQDLTKMQIDTNVDEADIMLVSVTERTREIGIRMAVGAKTWDIRLQFIIEALTLSLIGGITGIIIGIAGSKILSMLAGWPTIVSPLSILLAFGFSGLVGIFFGFYPAYKASLLNPIEALRYE